MDNLTVTGIVVGVVIVLLVLWMFFRTGHKTWWKIYLANNDVMLLYRDASTRWGTQQVSGFMVFKDEYGRRHLFTKNAEGWFVSGSPHWIIRMVEVYDNEVEITRLQIAEAKQARLREEAGDDA